MDWRLPREGSCRCGRVRLRVSAPPLFTSACHCTGCQKMSASAYSLSAAFPAAGFAVVAGEPVPGGLRGALDHRFCGDCMSWMFTRVPGLDDFVNVRASLLDGAADFAPFLETYVSEKLPFAATGAAQSFERFPPPEAFGALMAEFAAWAAARR